MTQPGPSAPWPNPPQVPPGGPRYCCFLAAGGDWCDCQEFADEAIAGFAPRDLALGHLGPIHIGVTR
jgi:hypothetical protein